MDAMMEHFVIFPVVNDDVEELSVLAPLLNLHWIFVL